MQFPVLNRVKSAFWALGLASWLVMAVMVYLVIGSNPDHWTSRYPESVRVNSVVRYMTITQKHVIEVSFVVGLFCVFGNVSLGRYIRDVSKP